jgi:predicted PhzF superfamily epimerase YddE/YHI9
MAELIAGLIDVFADAPLTGDSARGGTRRGRIEQRADAADRRRIQSGRDDVHPAKHARADRKLRSFTATGAEVFGAGHNALGAWLWLGEHGDLGSREVPRAFTQEIGQDVLPFERVNGRVRGRMRQAPFRPFDPLEDVGPLAQSLGLDDSDILLEPKPRPADTGAAHLMVRVLNAEIVDRARRQTDRQTDRQTARRSQRSTGRGLLHLCLR